MRKVAAKYWGKSLWSKVVIVSLSAIFWPITAVLIWKSIKHKNKLLKAGFIMFTIVFSSAWLGATSGALSGGKVGWGSASQVKQTVKSADFECIGPDGKKISLSQKACEEFNNKWSIIEPTEVPTQEIEQSTPETNAGAHSSISTNEEKVTDSNNVYDEGDKDCSDFATHAEAQSYFVNKGGSATNNVDRLDRDHDGIACETLP